MPKTIILTDSEASRLLSIADSLDAVEKSEGDDSYGDGTDKMAEQVEIGRRLAGELRALVEAAQPPQASITVYAFREEDSGSPFIFTEPDLIAYVNETFSPQGGLLKDMDSVRSFLDNNVARHDLAEAAIDVPVMPSAEGDYLLLVWGDVEPELHGPYPDYDAVLAEARAHRAKTDEDGVFHLYVRPDGKPEVFFFTGGEIDPSFADEGDTSPSP